MTKKERYEIECVCYVCGDRNKYGEYWEDAWEQCKLILCLNCVDEYEVEEIEEMPLVPIPPTEWVWNA